MWLTVRLRGSRSRQDIYASIQKFEAMTRIIWVVVRGSREGHHAAKRIAQRR
jgi:hypothetical protein